MTDEQVYDELVTVRENLYRDALEKISSRVVKDGDYEGAYWDMVLEADAALYPDEYSVKETDDGMGKTNQDS